MNKYGYYDHIDEGAIKDFVSVGQLIYLVPDGNSARYIKDDIYNHVKEMKVSKVGRKYFHLEGDDFNKYGSRRGYISDISNYSAECFIFLSKKDLENFKKHEELDKCLEKIKHKMNTMTIEDKVIIANVLNNY